MPEFNKHRFVSDMSESVVVRYRTYSMALLNTSSIFFTGNDGNNFTILVLITNQLTNLLCLVFFHHYFILYIFIVGYKH